MIETLIRNLWPGEKKLALPAFQSFADGLTQRFPEHAATDWQVLKAIWAFFRGAYHSDQKPADNGTARLAVRWLTGDRLEAEELRRFDLQPTETDLEAVDAHEERGLRVLVVLTEIAREGKRPFILCLDQVDVLSEEQIDALTKFLHVLLDAAKNLLTIFCGVQETLLPFVHRKVIAVATWDRLKNDEPLQLFGLDADGRGKFCSFAWRISLSR